MVGMQEKDKKLLLKLIVIFAFIFGFLSLFIPSFCVDYSDYYEKIGITNPETYSILESAPFYWHYVRYDFRNPENPLEEHTYNFFNIFKFQTGKTVDIETSFTYTEDLYLDKSSNIFITISSIYMASQAIIAALFIYVFYKGIKNIETKNRYFLYMVILIIISIIFYTIGVYYHESVKDINNLGYTSFITIQYGFYLGLISLILFFFAYILQNHYPKYANKKI